MFILLVLIFILLIYIVLKLQFNDKEKELITVQGSPDYTPFRYRGTHHAQQADPNNHVYYDPEIRSPLLDDVLMSRIPNYSLNQKFLGQKYGYLTDYKKNIMGDHQPYLERNRVKRAWWF